jgi:hypothetical protein
MHPRRSEWPLSSYPLSSSFLFCSNISVAAAAAAVAGAFGCWRRPHRRWPAAAAGPNFITFCADIYFGAGPLPSIARHSWNTAKIMDHLCRWRAAPGLDGIFHSDDVPLDEGPTVAENGRPAASARKRTSPHRRLLSFPDGPRVWHFLRRPCTSLFLSAVQRYSQRDRHLRPFFSPFSCFRRPTSPPPAVDDWWPVRSLARSLPAAAASMTR